MKRVALVTFLISQSVWAQPSTADDELEVPASPGGPTAPAPGAKPGEPAPAPSAAPIAAAPSAQELDELRKRIAALEAAQQKVPPAPIAEPATAPKNEPKEDALPFGLRIGGYLQTQFEHNQQSEDQLLQGQPLNQNRFVLRRGRLRVDREWEYAAATLELDANTVRGVSFGVRRAEGTLWYRGKNANATVPLVAATLGVTDIPFGYELGVEPTRRRAFMERSVGTLALFPTDADVGLRVWGGYEFLRYAVAIMNGEPLDNSGFPRDPNAAKDVIGRFGVDVAPLPLVTLTGGASFATGKGFHAGQQATKDSVVWNDTNLDGDLDDGELVPVPGTASTPSENFERWALGLDLGAVFHTKFGDTKLYGEAFVASNYDRGFARADPVVSGVDVRHTGAYVALLQDVTRFGIAGFRFAYYDPNSDLTEQRQGEFVPLDQSVITLSPLAGLVLKDQARLLFQYDFVRDHLGRDERGVPADLRNDSFTLRLQVEL